MSTYKVGPLNLFAGYPLQLPAAQWPSPNQTGFVVIANNTPFTLDVNTANGGKWLYSNTSDLFVPGGNVISVLPLCPLPTLTPQTATQTGAILIGTLTATYYSIDEPQPGGFPQSIPGIADGSVLLGTRVVSSVGACTGYFAVPAGASSLTIVNKSPNQYVLQELFGVQTNHEYTSGSVVLQPYSSTTVNLVPPPGDSDSYYYFNLFPNTNVGSGDIEFWASPVGGLTIPEIPVGWGDFILIPAGGGIATLLGAPPAGIGYYIFGIDFMNLDSTHGANRIDISYGNRLPTSVGNFQQAGPNTPNTSYLPLSRVRIDAGSNGLQAAQETGGSDSNALYASTRYGIGP